MYAIYDVLVMQLRSLWVLEYSCLCVQHNVCVCFFSSPSFEIVVEYVGHVTGTALGEIPRPMFVRSVQHSRSIVILEFNMLRMHKISSSLRSRRAPRAQHSIQCKWCVWCSMPNANTVHISKCRITILELDGRVVRWWL